MKIKYRSGYADGGFLDDGAVVDEVSGNEVPTGSLEEEVRDDIPAQLSEGEFVVPADVVRFIGLDKLMKMRDAAKKGLASMEAEGQIGGSPAPAMSMEMESMDMENDDRAMDALIEGMDTEGFEGEAQNFAKGGMPTYESYTGRKFNEPETIQHLKYVNAEGESMTIPTLRGKALRPIPEGFYLYVAPDEEDVVEEEKENEVEVAVENTNRMTDNERRNNATLLSNSDKEGRKRYKELESLAKSDMSQTEINDFYGKMTTQEKNLYEDRMKDPKWIDSFMTKGMAPIDRMLAAVKTVHTINQQQGLSLNKSSTSTTGKETSLKEFAKYAAAALIGGIPGLMTLEKVKDLGIDHPTVIDSIKEYISTIGEGSGRTGNEDTQPVGATPTKYDQEHWKQFAGASSTDIAAEQLRIAQETGLNAYGNKLSPEEIKALNKTADKKDYADKIQRTKDQKIRDAKAAEALRIAQEQDDLLRGDHYTSNADTTEIEEIVDKATVNRAAQVAKERADKIDKNAAAAVVTGDTEDRSGPPGMYDSDEKDKVKTKAEEAGYAGVSGGGGKAKGGLLTKADKPKVKKMRKDNTSGLAAKKKSKEKAKAKKGALAAKRT